MNTALRISTGARLGSLCAVAIIALASHAALAGTEALVGEYKGTYLGQGHDPEIPVSGPTSVKVRATNDGEGAKVKLKGKAPDGTIFSAKLVFNPDGTCTTTALVPGVLEVPGSGTWTMKGKKIAYKLSGFVLIVDVSTTGTIKKAGSKLKIKGKADRTPIPLPEIPLTGEYTYTGQ